MDLSNSDQITGIALFVLGCIILTVCSRSDRSADERMRDPKIKWAVLEGRKDDEIKRKSIISTILTILGAGLALYGMVLFLMHVKTG